MAAPEEEIRRSPTVDGVLSDAGDGPLPVTRLIDAVLSRHPEYLQAWPTTAARWPQNLLFQRPDRWMAELAPLIRAEQVFGRLAVLGWSLLDADVALVASANGLLAAMIDDFREPVSDLLSPAGVRLLQRRAPSAAFSAGLLSPTVDLLGVAGGGPVERITLGRTPRVARGVGLWAVSYEDKVWAGTGAQSKRVFQDDPTAPRTMSISRNNVLHVVDLGGNVVRGYRYGDDRVTHDEWSPGLWIFTSDEDAILGFDHGAGGDTPPLLAWGHTDGGGPVPLSPLFGNEVGLLAVAGPRVAVVSDDQVWFGGPDQEWQRMTYGGEAIMTISADETGVAYGTSQGLVITRPWEESGVAASAASSERLKSQWIPVPALPGQEIAFSARGGGRTVVASSSEVALMQGVALEARWQPEEGKYITAVALSPDGSTLAIVGSLMLRFWRLDTASEMRLTSFTADTPEGEDLLGIQPTVDALAALVAARAVEPPLSVGLFGAWGSGKSFFMRKVEQRVREITDESRSSQRPQASMWAWRNIRHVRFNAWQYAAADVWAGMLEELVRELARPSAGKTLDLPLPTELSALEKERIQRLAGAMAVAEDAAQELETAQQAMDKAVNNVAAARREMVTARAQVVDTRNQAVTDVVQDEAVVSLDTALTAAGLPPVGADLRDTWRELEMARRSAESSGALLRERRTMLLVTITAAPVFGLAVAAVLAWAGAAVPWLTGALTALLTFLASGSAWLRGNAQSLQAKIEKIKAGELEARKVEAAILAKQAEAERALHVAELKVEDARLAAEAAEREVTAAEARITNVTPGALVQEYLEGRQKSDDYRAMLGLIGTVRRDLDVISQGVVAHNDELSDDADAGLDDVVNRVVLYVDDLDRCRPDVVVKVLEAVSMLMSFPLFVVIVAVDSHWISRSLTHVYRDMLSDGQVTPDHYLEKIFQLPVWLEPPQADAARAMARHLLGVASEGEPHAATVADVDDAVTNESGVNAADASTAPLAEPSQMQVIEEVRNVDLATTPPESVALEPSETAAIAELAPLLTRSPRALKRYLNTYRLLKALVDPSELALARVLLAVATGRPETGERLFSAILPDAEDQTIADVIEPMPETDRAWLGLAPDPAWFQVRCSDAWPVSQQVRRFIFRSEPRAAERPEE